jgi:hypothetical protein
MHCPEEGLEKLEEVSYWLKNGNKDEMSRYLKTNDNKYYASGSQYPYDN